MFFLLSLILIFLSLISSQTIKHLNEISINEELPIGSIVTSLTDKIPNLDQSIEYDLVTPLSIDLDLFSIDHNQHYLRIKNRIDYEYICLKKHQCIISVSIAVSNDDTIDVYILPIRIKNLNDNPIKFLVNRTVIQIEENDENWFKKTYPLPKAYDDDGDLITYSIYLQNWNKPNGLFEFNEENLTLKPLKKFDREEQNIYLLRLIAHNQNDASTDIIILIKDINDNSPKCQQNQTKFFISNISNISIFLLNVTDLDEGDNSKLEYQFINPLAGFHIDRYNGQIKFDYKQWKHSNESILIINISDHGKPFRLSTKCFIEIKFTFLFDIHFQTNFSFINQTNISVEIQNLNLPIGQLKIYDKQKNQTCKNCLIHLHSSLKDIFYFNHSTYNLYLNLNSIIFKKILTNYSNQQENLSLNLQIDIKNLQNPSIISTKNYSLILHFNKLNFLIHSNQYFFKIYENMLINEHISIYNRYHYCLNNQSKDLILIDSTNTFKIDQNSNLILKKYLNIKQQNIYHLILQNNSTNQTNLCSIQLQVYVINPYSIDTNFPYFFQSFYILSSKNLSEFSLPLLPSYVKYISSVPNLISIDPYNRSIIIRSSLLYSSYYYDFQIEIIDFHTPSLSSSISIRIFFGINKYSPRLLMNSTSQSIEILSSNFLYQIKAYDPDILFNDQINLFPPSIEYQIETSTNNNNNNNIEIERFTGRIFLKDFNQTKINFTLIMTDFGQPNRLITRQILIFNIKSQENLSISFFLITLSIILMIIFLSIIFILINCCCANPKKSLKSHEKSTWKNISPTAPDTHLIDNEYITTTTTSLPRVSNNEQRIYPIFSHKNYSYPRRNLSHLSLDKINYQYSTEKILIKQDYYHQHLSMTDINKYLERFEKIYQDSSSQQYLHQPIGSVV